MQLVCPKCGMRDVRVSRPHGLSGLLKSACGISPLKCRHCNSRWETSVWANGSWKYARCPRCYRQELTKWTMEHYSPPKWTRLLLRIGARPLRCPACRCNFASFKPRRGTFEWQHQTRVEVGARVPDRDGAISEQTPPGEESGEQMP
jgi:hypothetical protein